MQKRHFEMETVTAASCFEDLTLTIGLTPSDFIWQGFMQGKKDGCKEWPIEGEYVKDDVTNWFWNLHETGISGSKKIPERMPQSASGY